MSASNPKIQTPKFICTDFFSGSMPLSSCDVHLQMREPEVDHCTWGENHPFSSLPICQDPVVCPQLTAREAGNVVFLCALVEERNSSVQSKSLVWQPEDS